MLASTDALVELGHGLGLGVAGLDLVAHLVERRHVVADRLVELAIALFICSCIFAWSSWRQQLLALGQLLLQRTGVLLDRRLGLVGAWVDCRTSVFRSSTSFSTWISWVAMVSAAECIRAALAASPAFSASSAMIRAWRALAFSFSSSPMRLFSRISACFWLAMTLAACSLSRRCWSCASLMACSSWTLGSAFSLNVPVSLAVR